MLLVLVVLALVVLAFAMDFIVSCDGGLAAYLCLPLRQRAQQPALGRVVGHDPAGRHTHTHAIRAALRRAYSLLGAVCGRETYSLC